MSSETIQEKSTRLIDQANGALTLMKLRQDEIDSLKKELEGMTTNDYRVGNISKRIDSAQAFFDASRNTFIRAKNELKSLGIEINEHNQAPLTDQKAQREGQDEGDFLVRFEKMLYQDSNDALVSPHESEKMVEQLNKAQKLLLFDKTVARLQDFYREKNEKEKKRSSKQDELLGKLLMTIPYGSPNYLGRIRNLFSLYLEDIPISEETYKENLKQYINTTLIPGILGDIQTKGQEKMREKIIQRLGHEITSLVFDIYTISQEQNSANICYENARTLLTTLTWGNYENGITQAIIQANSDAPPILKKYYDQELQQKIKEARATIQ